MNVNTKLIPGTVSYGASSLVYYGKKKRDADDNSDIVGSVVLANNTRFQPLQIYIKYIEMHIDMSIYEIRRNRIYFYICIW